MLKPPCDAHEALIRLGPNLKEISCLVDDRRWPSGERQRLADMLLGYFLGLACEHKLAQLHLVHDRTAPRTRARGQPFLNLGAHVGLGQGAPDHHGAAEGPTNAPKQRNAFVS